MIRDFHDDGVEIYLDGVLAYRAHWAVSHYETLPVSFNAREAVIPKAENVLTVKCNQSGEWQYIDFGLSLRQRDGC